MATAGNDEITNNGWMAWEARVMRVARRLDIPVTTTSWHGAVKVRLEDLEALADQLQSYTGVR